MSGPLAERPSDVQPTTLDQEGMMAKGDKKTGREAKKPKKEVPKTIAAAPSTKGTTIKK